MCAMWQRLNPDAVIHLAYGGRREVFGQIAWPHRTFVADERLRTRDHQRERQSYQGVMRAVSLGTAQEPVDRVLMVECDVLPLRPGLVEYLSAREREEAADVLGVRLRRVDGTGHPHVLAHESHPNFAGWLGASVRPEKETVLMMLGCLTWWTWEAFTAVATTLEPLPIYLELAMPTMAHQRGFRVRDLPELVPDMSPLGELGHLAESRRAASRWVLHPCKNCWRTA